VNATGTAGITSLSFWDLESGIAAGGDIAAPDARQENVAILSDGGRSARLTTSSTFPGGDLRRRSRSRTSLPIVVASVLKESYRSIRREPGCRYQKTATGAAGSSPLASGGWSDPTG
jgi:hypothetical protein